MLRGTGLIRRRLWIAAALAPLSFAAVARAAPITGATSTPVTTNGADVTIDSGGSIAVNQTTAATAGPATVTVNTNNSVSNSGALSSTETTSYTDTNADGIVDTNTTAGVATPGQYAVGASRYGVQVLDGVTGGSISNIGSITVVGENSAGISIGTGGLSGDLANSGTISITGGDLGTNHVSYGIFSKGLITGSVSLTGSVTATGQNAQAVALLGGVTGGVTVSGALTATGYRATTAPTYVGYRTILYSPTTDAQIAAAPAELLQGGPALNIGGSVGGGVNITAATASPAVTEGVVTSYGSAPAILIGGTSPLTIGAVASDTSTTPHGLVIGGAVTGAGTYQNFDGTGVQIGGGSYGAVNVTGGVLITGAVTGSAETADVGAVPGSNTAIGLHIGAGATVSNIDVESVKTVSGSTTSFSSGSLAAVVASNSPTGAPTATALKIDAGGSATTLTNSGTISATIEGLTTTAANGASTTAGGTRGTATAVLDLAGSLTSITNTRTISAAITPPVGTLLDTTAGAVNAVALDLQLNTTSVTVTQSANLDSTTAAPITPSITGDILFGKTGSGTLNVLAGTVTGAVTYGSGAANGLTIDNGATVTGAVTQADNGLLGLNVANGTLNDRSTAHLNASSLHVGSTGVIVMDATPSSAGSIVLGAGDTATLDPGAKVGLNFTSKLTQGAAPVAYTVVDASAGTLIHGAIDTSFAGLVPYFYTSAVSTTGTSGGPGTVVLTVGVADPHTLGLNTAEITAFNPIYKAFSADTAVNTALLSKTDKADFVKLYDQFLPDFAGGGFESLAAGQQAVHRAQAETPVKLQSDESRGWVEEIGFDAHHDNTASNGYDGHGFGIVAGLESAHGDSAVGVTAAFLTTGVDNAAQTNNASLSASVAEVGVYWRASSDGLSVTASADGGWAFFNSRRFLYDTSQSPVLNREADAGWNGGLLSAQLETSYQMNVGRYYVRPEVAVDYVMLYEAAHAEHGGGPAVDLAIASRTNTQATARADLVFGANFGTTIRWRPELTLGWRDVIAGGPADTSAHFVNVAGTGFTLSPNYQDKGGVLARLGLHAGGNYADISADAGGQFRSGYQTYDARAVARFLF